MRGQSDKVVAIIVTRLDSLSENLAVQTMLPAFYEQGYDPIMMESQFSPALVEEHLGMLARRNIDGVVLFGFTGISEEMLTPWRERWCCWPATRRDSPPSAMTTRRDQHADAAPVRSRTSPHQLPRRTAQRRHHRAAPPSGLPRFLQHR
jgi:hypothetical protein